MSVASCDAEATGRRRSICRGAIAEVAVKDKLLRFDGRPLFPEWRTYSPTLRLPNRCPPASTAVRTDYTRTTQGRGEQLRLRAPTAQRGIDR